MNGKNTVTHKKISYRKLLNLLLFILFLIVLRVSWDGAEMSPMGLIKDSSNMIEFIQDFFPPDFSDWSLFLKEMLITVYIAIWGTLLAIVCAIPLGLICAQNIGPKWFRIITRRVMDALRSINEIVFAMIFVAAVGLGPFPGVLALFMHSLGCLSKLFSEAVEAIESDPVEGVKATGASKLQEIIYGVIPQVLPLWISLSLYRFESNVRSATVVGMVGAGGIGVLVWEYIRSFDFAKTSAVILIIIITVSIIDIASQFLRKKYI